MAMNPVVAAQTALPQRARSALHLQQEQVSRLLDLAQHLNPSERAIVQAVYERGLRIGTLESAADVKPNRLKHRLRRIVRRLESDQFRIVLVHSRRWPEELRETARLMHLRGRTLRQVSTITGLTLHQVRCRDQKIRALIELHRRESAVGPTDKAA